MCIFFAHLIITSSNPNFFPYRCVKNFVDVHPTPRSRLPWLHLALQRHCASSRRLPRYEDPKAHYPNSSQPPTSTSNLPLLNLNLNFHLNLHLSSPRSLTLPLPETQALCDKQTPRPLSVRRYFCNLLFGFSGIVNSMRPSSTRS